MKEGEKKRSKIERRDIYKIIVIIKNKNKDASQEGKHKHAHGHQKDKKQSSLFFLQVFLFIR
jgi:hypothetical protein